LDDQQLEMKETNSKTLKTLYPNVEVIAMNKQTTCTNKSV